MATTTTSTGAPAGDDEPFKEDPLANAVPKAPEGSTTTNKGLMDFGNEDDDDNDDGKDLLAGPPAAAGTSTKEKKAALMDFGDEDEEEDDDQQNMLLASEKKKTKKMVISDVSEDEEEDEEESEEHDEEEEREKREKKRNRHIQESPTKGDEEMEDVEEDDRSRSEGGSYEYDEQVETIESITIPNLESFRPNMSTKCYFGQLPRFLYIAGGAFDEDGYRFEKEKKEIKARNGEQLVGDEIIRWRVKRDGSGKAQVDSEGQPILESNARIVEYTDGTYQLFVGDESIDLKLSNTSNEFLYARAENGSERLYLQALGKIEGQASFRPAGPDSKQQKALESLVKKQQVKTVNMVDTNPEHDPEKEQDEKIKKVDAFHRTNLRRRNRAENAQASKRRKYGEDWNTAYLEKQETAGKKRQAASGKRKTTKKRSGDDDEELEDEEEEEELDDFIASSSSEDDDDDDDDEDEA